MYFLISAVITALAIASEYQLMHSPRWKTVTMVCTGVFWLFFYFFNAAGWENENSTGRFWEIFRRAIGPIEKATIVMFEAVIVLFAVAAAADPRLTVYWPGVIAVLIAIPLVLVSTFFLSALSAVSSWRKTRVN